MVEETTEIGCRRRSMGCDFLYFPMYFDRHIILVEVEGSKPLISPPLVVEDDMSLMTPLS